MVVLQCNIRGLGLPFDNHLRGGAVFTSWDDWSLRHLRQRAVLEPGLAVLSCFVPLILLVWTALQTRSKRLETTAKGRLWYREVNKDLLRFKFQLNDLGRTFFKIFLNTGAIFLNYWNVSWSSLHDSDPHLGWFREFRCDTMWHDLLAPNLQVEQRLNSDFWSLGGPPLLKTTTSLLLTIELLVVLWLST